METLPKQMYLCCRFYRNLNIRNFRMKNVSVLGCGWLGKPLAVELLNNGFFVKGSTTSESKIEDLEQFSIELSLICRRVSGDNYLNVTKAIKDIDPEATVLTDPPTRKVTVKTSLSVEKVSYALIEAGFPPRD